MEPIAGQDLPRLNGEGQRGIGVGYLRLQLDGGDILDLRAFGPTGIRDHFPLAVLLLGPAHALAGGHVHGAADILCVGFVCIGGVAPVVLLHEPAIQHGGQVHRTKWAGSRLPLWRLDLGKGAVDLVVDPSGQQVGSRRDDVDLEEVPQIDGFLDLLQVVVGKGLHVGDPGHVLVLEYDPMRVAGEVRHALVGHECRYQHHGHTFAGSLIDHVQELVGGVLLGTAESGVA